MSSNSDVMMTKGGGALGWRSELTSSKEDSRFIPKATPIRPNREREKVPMVNWRFRRIITLR